MVSAATLTKTPMEDLEAKITISFPKELSQKQIRHLLMFVGTKLKTCKIRDVREQQAEYGGPNSLPTEPRTEAVQFTPSLVNYDMRGEVQYFEPPSLKESVQFRFYRNPVKRNMEFDGLRFDAAGYDNLSEIPVARVNLMDMMRVYVGEYFTLGCPKPDTSGNL